MIYGIGVDILEAQRVDRLLKLYGDRFARRVLTDLEWPDYERTSRPVYYVANRFAAKEAFSKAMGTGFRHPVTLQNISIVQNKAGKPGYVLGDALQALANSEGITGHHVTISDEKAMVCAMAVIEK